MFGLPGWLEFAVVGIILLLIFGRRLPGVMRGVGQGITEFRRAAGGSDGGNPDRQVACDGRDPGLGEALEAESSESGNAS